MKTSNPLTVVIVPLRDSGSFVNVLVRSLLDQDYLNFRVILCGNVNESTWAHILPEYRRDSRLILLEAELPKGHPGGRDANVKREFAARYAVQIGAAYLVFTDAKIRHAKTWLSEGVSLVEQWEVDAVGGEMISTPEKAGTFWARFTDDALKKRNPNFSRKARIITAENFGEEDDLPITACLLVTVEMYAKTKGFPWWFVDSYEDYSFDWELARNGARILCIKWQVYHEHRTDPKAIQLEYARSGRGAAQMLQSFPECPFSQRRLAQVIAVFTLLALGVIVTAICVALGLIFQLWIPLLLVLIVALLGITGLGVLNAFKAKHWHGLFFPPLTMWFIFVFSLNFVRKLWEKGATRSAAFLQKILPMLLELILQEMRL